MLANTFPVLSQADAEDVPIKHRLVLTEYVTPLHTNQTEDHLQVRNIHQLANDNILAAHEGKGAHAFEVTREKKVVWKWDDHSLIKSLTTVRVIGE